MRVVLDPRETQLLTGLGRAGTIADIDYAAVAAAIATISSNVPPLGSHARQLAALLPIPAQVCACVCVCVFWPWYCASCPDISRCVCVCVGFICRVVSNLKHALPDIIDPSVRMSAGSECALVCTGAVRLPGQAARRDDADRAGSLCPSAACTVIRASWRGLGKLGLSGLCKVANCLLGTHIRPIGHLGVCVCVQQQHPCMHVYICYM